MADGNRLYSYDVVRVVAMFFCYRGSLTFSCRHIHKYRISFLRYWASTIFYRQCFIFYDVRKI